MDLVAVLETMRMENFYVTHNKNKAKAVMCFSLNLLIALSPPETDLTKKTDTRSASLGARTLVTKGNSGYRSQKCET